MIRVSTTIDPNSMPRLYQKLEQTPVRQRARVLRAELCRLELYQAEAPTLPAAGTSPAQPQLSAADDPAQDLVARELARDFM